MPRCARFSHRRSHIRPSNGQYDVHFINKVGEKQQQQKQQQKKKGQKTTTTKQNINQQLNIGTIQGIEIMY